MNYFEWREGSDGKFAPCPNWENIGIERTEGSGLVLPARFLGLDWIQYLKFCRQNGAQLIGKHRNFVRPCWIKKNDEFMKILNDRAAALSKIIDLRGLIY